MRLFSLIRVPVIFGGLLAGMIATSTLPASAQELVTGHATAKNDPYATAPLPEGNTLQQIMPPEVFNSSGLKKLNPKELATLNEWLQSYRSQAEKVAVEKIIPPPSPKRQTIAPVLESSIKGEFNGLKGRTRMLLANGQVWQQTNSTDTFSAHLTNPYCVLVKNSFGYKMLIAGMGRPFYVRQIVLE